MEPETAGDPMGKLLNWTRKSTYKLSEELKRQNINISPNTSGKMLKHLKYSLRSNRKSISATCHPDRNCQFEYINTTVQQFKNSGGVIISVDTKKKESIGNFSNNGKKYDTEPEYTLDHDFISYAIGKINPFGIYEPLTNKGAVVLGTSYDTPEFAVDAIDMWLNNVAFQRYSEIKKLLILCDSGGSNSCRKHGWKYYLYKKISSVYGIEIQVCHYPSGASKWNPIEHKMFSHISKNWQGVPLRSYELAMNYINTTTTKKGLTVKAFLNEKEYEKGVCFDKKQVEKEIIINRNEFLPQWNYKILH